MELATDYLYNRIDPAPLDSELWFKPDKTIHDLIHIIDVTLQHRASIPPNIMQDLYNHVVQPSFDLSDRANLLMVVSLANLMPGPIIIYINHIVGYGLFAERDYTTEKEVVTTYGGEVTRYKRAKDNIECKGDYSILIDRKTCIDGKYYFKLFEKGRFINEDHTVPFNGNVKAYQKELLLRENVNLVPERNGENPKFRVKSTFGLSIQKGYEFFWYYGEDYDRTWLNVQDQKKQKIGACIQCGKATTLGCAKCWTVYCSDECKNKYQHYCW